MDFNEKRLLLSRIIAGQIKFNGQLIHIPRLDYESESVYQEYYNKAINEGCLTNDEIMSFMGAPFDFEKQIIILGQLLSDQKLELYYHRDNPDNTRSKIQETKHKISQCYEEYYKYYIYSCEFIASFARDLWSIKKLNKKIKRPSEITLFISNSKVPESSIRELSRSEPWTTIQLADIKFKSPTEEQCQLIAWTRRYKNILQHPERPEDFVIEDDDMLDGWFIHLSKQEKNKQHSPVKGNEVFKQIRPRDGEKFSDAYERLSAEAKNVYDQNSIQAKIAIVQRERKIDLGKDVKEVELPDVRKELLMRINRGPNG